MHNPSQMRITLDLDRDLLCEARRLTGLRAKTDIIHAGQRALITRESARRLAALGGKLPKAEMPSRRRSRRLR